LDSESPLSRASIDQAASAQIAKARAQTNPLMRAADEALIRHARKQVELSVLDEANYWAKLDARFATSARELGVDSSASNWKNMADLANAWGRIDAQFKAGQLSTFQYEQLMQSIVDMTQTLRPVYSQLGKAANRNFMDRVWATSSGSSSAQLSATEAYFKSLNIGADFQKAVDTFSGLSPSAATAAQDAEAEQLIAKVSSDLEKNPGQAISKLQSLIRVLRLRRDK